MVLAWPLALPLWRAGLVNTLGRVVSVEQIHVILYALLGTIVGWCAVPGPKRTAGWLLLLVLAVGYVDEAAQQLMPQRVFQWSDVWLNWAGGLSALVVTAAGRWIFSVRRRTIRD